MHKQSEPFPPNMQTTKENQGSSTRPAEQHQQITRCSHHGLPPPLHHSLGFCTQRRWLQKLQRPVHLQGSNLKNSEQTKKTEHCSQGIDPGLGNQLIRIFAISFRKLQNIDKLLLALREAWNKGIRDYKNKPKQMANKKKRLEKKHAIS